MDASVRERIRAVADHQPAALACRHLNDTPWVGRDGKRLQSVDNLVLPKLLYAGRPNYSIGVIKYYTHTTSSGHVGRRFRTVIAVGFSSGLSVHGNILLSAI